MESALVSKRVSFSIIHTYIFESHVAHLLSDTNRIQCYYNKRCKGKGRYVSSEAECCYQYPDDYDGDRSAHTLQYIRPYSYNNGYGQCYTWYDKQ